MTLIRSFIYLPLMALSVIFFATTIGLFSYFIDANKLSNIANCWGRINIFLLRTICRLRMDIKGWDNLPFGEPFILMAKHQSTWETIVLRGILPANQVWIIKKELINYPFFGRALKKTGQIAIDRSHGRQALNSLIEQGISALSQKKMIIIFPEGTRTEYGHQTKYHIGGAFLAEKCQCPVIPIAHNAGKFWPKGFYIRPGVVKLIIGEPISTKNLKAKEINSLCKNWIEETTKSI